MITAKLWRMGRTLSKKNSRQRQILLKRWDKMTWKLQLTAMEVRSTLIEEKNDLTQQLHQERSKKSVLLEEAEQKLKEVQAENARLQAQTETWVNGRQGSVGSISLVVTSD